MPADPQEPAAGLTVDLDELRAGVRQLDALAEETKGKLAPSDRALEDAKPAWQGLKAADAFAQYAEGEVARGKTVADTFTATADKVGSVVERYAGADSDNAANLSVKESD